MTRKSLTEHKTRLEAAARARDLMVDFTIAGGASEADLARCESSIGVRLPAGYRAALAEWNGCDIEIYGTELGSDRKLYRGSFAVANAEMASLWTRTIRHNIAVAMQGKPVAEGVATMMSRIAVITHHDDLAAFLTCDSDVGESDVRLIDMEYAVSQFPPETPIIASSPDEYLEKCLGHLTETLETEIYW